MKLTGRASCLLTHRWIFASGHYFGCWSPVQQEASYQQQLSCHPTDLFRAFRIWLTPVKQGTLGVQSLRHSAGTSGIHGHGWQVCVLLSYKLKRTRIAETETYYNDHGELLKIHFDRIAFP